MNTDEITGTKYLDHGDVVTINGKKYLCEEQSPDYSHCWECAFSTYGGCQLPKELKYECSANWVALIPVEKVIEREQEEIEEHQRYIKYLQELWHKNKKKPWKLLMSTSRKNVIEVLGL